MTTHSKRLVYLFSCASETITGSDVSQASGFYYSLSEFGRIRNLVKPQFHYP